MTKLSWTYDDRGMIESAEYRGFLIKAPRDSHAENPFESWDCEPPTLVYLGRDGFTDYSGGDLDRPLREMNDRKIARNWRLIANALDLTPEAVRQEIQERRADYGETADDTRRELFETALDDMRGNNGTDYLETLATLWRIAGCVASTWTARGYSQSDWAEGLSVATPEWMKTTGCDKASALAACDYAGKLYGFWAYGDVYGFTIHDLDGEEIDDADSTWGFYGDDHAESGLEEAARDSVDCLIRSRAKARQTKAAEMIRARVPLYLRPAILDAAAVA